MFVLLGLIVVPPVTAEQMSGSDHRKQFFAPIIDKIERALAVRSISLFFPC
ncbi:hypothetical protein ACWED2_12560 [Amycolatopsis sp. NPDC005003]